MIEELLSGIFGAILGAGISFLTLRYNYRDLYARNISANRMEWINNFREEISIVIATLRSSPDIDSQGYVFEAEKARAKLLTRLNMDISKIGNEYNGVMANTLESIDFSNIPSNSKCIAENLVDLSRKILEPEWQRVKKEAGGDEK